MIIADETILLEAKLGFDLRYSVIGTNTLRPEIVKQICLAKLHKPVLDIIFMSFKVL